MAQVTRNGISKHFFLNTHLAGKTEYLTGKFSDILLNETEKPVVVTTYCLETRKFHLFTSYDDEDFKVVDVCNASSAAPGYFPAISVNDGWFIDGGVVANNPSMVGYAKARELWGDEEIFLISVGTGHRVQPIDGTAAVGWGGIQWLPQLLDITMDESIVDSQASTILNDHYLRVNSDLCTAQDAMDNITEENLAALTDLGNKWWDICGTQAVLMLQKAGRIPV